jgi:hypothetical protein
MIAIFFPIEAKNRADEDPAKRGWAKGLTCESDHD